MTTPFRLNDELFLLKHPFYRAWMEGQISRKDLQDYARQYYHHVQAFPQYLRNALNVCTDEKARTILAENLAEEDGSAYGVSHPELWLRFVEGTGIAREEADTALLRAGIRQVVMTFQNLSKASYAQALGALYAYESQVPEIAHSKIEGLKQHYGITDERSLAFFEVHKTADVEHRESILALLESLSPAEKSMARQAADQACQALWDFLSDVNDQRQCA